MQVSDIKITGKRGVTEFNGEVFGALNTFTDVEKRIGQFTTTKEGTWWHTIESWEWALIPSREYFSEELRTRIIT